MRILRVVFILLLAVSNIFSQDIWEYLTLLNKEIQILDLNQVEGKNLIGTVGGLYYSKDNYKTILFDDNFPSKMIRKIVVDSSNIYLLCDTIFKSSEIEKTWNKLPYIGNCNDLIESKDKILIGGFYDELPHGPPSIAGVFYFSPENNIWEAGKQFSYWQVSNIVCDNQNNIYMSAQDMYKDPMNAFSIFISKDNGKSVSNISKGYPGLPVNSIYVNKVTDDVYLCTYNGLFKYTSSDSSWVLVGLNNKRVKSLIIYKNIFYTITRDFQFDSVMVSTDQGINWNLYTSGFGNYLSYNEFNINALTIDSEEFIYAGTSNGLYKANLYNPVGIKEVKPNIPKEFKLEQNYPNPFNPSTTIKYSILKTQLVTLKIFDILGKEIISLVNEEKLPGEYSINFDGSSLTSGVYICRMHAGNFIDTKKLTLIK